MHKFLTLLALYALCAVFALPPAQAVTDDIYAVRFTQDGRHLVTAGSHPLLEATGEERGVIKLWDVRTGRLVSSFGNARQVHAIFGDDHGRVGKRRWTIHSFKDLVVNGSYPNGKIVLLPASLGRIEARDDIELPEFVGGYLDFGGRHVSRIPIPTPAGKARTCMADGSMYEYAGPIVASTNGRYAAVVINTCKRKNDRKVPIAQYDSSLHVIDLDSLKVIHSVKNIDSGVYALGISNDGTHVGFVGRDRFAVLDLATGKERVIERYENAVFQLPRQFSALYFNQDATQLVSLHYLLDLRTGKETKLKWEKDSPALKGRTSSVHVAPDLSFFLLIKPKRSLIVFGEDGLPRTYGKSDRIYLLDTRTGKSRELKISDSVTEGKRCRADISPDASKVAVGCAGGLLKLFDARTGKVLWEKHRIGLGRDPLSRRLHPARNTPWMPVPLLQLAQIP
ncbi:MAG: WD40 repeat domain-containing protein [Gammaproteobacteria bacterium]|nr:MAG: WD40 repeat domain-containing protein [Gammaproteobacteria bacterium]